MAMVGDGGFVVSVGAGSIQGLARMDRLTLVRSTLGSMIGAFGRPLKVTYASA